MLTDTQAGGRLSLSAPPLGKDARAQDAGMQARSEVGRGFAAVLAETETAARGSGTPVADSENADTAPAGADHPDKAEPDVAEPDVSGAPHDGPITHHSAGEGEGGPSEAVKTAKVPRDTGDEVPPGRPRTGAASTGPIETGPALMSAPNKGPRTSSQSPVPDETTRHAAVVSQPRVAPPSAARDQARPAPLVASTDSAAMPARSGENERPRDAHTARAAGRPAQAAFAAVAAANPDQPSPRAPATVALRAGGARANAPFGLSRATSDTALSARPSPDRERRPGEGSTPGRPTLSVMTPTSTPALSGAPQAGQTPVAGGGLSFVGELSRSEHARTSDAGPSAADTRGTNQSGAVASPPSTTAAPRQDLPQQIVVQIAAAAEKGASGTQKNVDLHLNPSELGRVRLRMSPSETGLNVVILAERGETLDLLRRNIDMLAREFLEIGYENASFDFAEGQPDHGEGHAPPPRQPMTDTPGPTPDIRAGAPALITLGDRLDIRL